ncbi:unnamed protein product, partial [Brassica oleracea var. botrytis]
DIIIFQDNRTTFVLSSQSFSYTINTFAHLLQIIFWFSDFSIMTLNLGHKDFSIPIAKIFKKKTTTELVSDRCLKFTGEICLRRH